MYNLTAMEAERSLAGIFSEVNTLSGGMIINLFLIVLFFIVFILLGNYETKQKLITASLITTGVAYLSYLSGLCAIGTVVIPLVILVIAIFYYIVS